MNLAPVACKTEVFRSTSIPSAVIGVNFGNHSSDSSHFGYLLSVVCGTFANFDQSQEECFGKKVEKGSLL